MTGPHPMTHPESVEAGAYVLGALSEAERLAFEAHRRGCPECAEAVAGISEVPALLGLVPADVAAAMTAARDDGAGTDEHLSGTEPLPTSVLGALLSAVRGHEARERRRRRWVGGLAAAAVLVLGVVVAQQPGMPWQQGTTSEEQRLELVATEESDAPMTASVVLTAAEWGTRIDLTCGYGGQGAGGPDYGPKGAYSLVVRDASGGSEEVATWEAGPGAAVTLPAATMTPLEEIVEVELRDAAGTSLLAARR